VRGFDDLSLNRGNRPAQVFSTDGDYQACPRAVGNVYREIALSVPGDSLMPNQFRVVLGPGADGLRRRFLLGKPIAHERCDHRNSDTSGRLTFSFSRGRRSR
jgi:hypothetical protein